jgi:hypothetical protein
MMFLTLILSCWFLANGFYSLISGNHLQEIRWGKLGSWSQLVSAFRFDPHGKIFKWLHVLFGFLLFLTLLANYFFPSLGGWFVLGCAIAMLWYLPAGLFLGLILIASALLCRPCQYSEIMISSHPAF